MSVAYQGAAGAFSHEACRRFLADHEAVAYPTFFDVVAAVADGEAELGLLPIANNEAGETGNRQLIGKAGLHVVEEHVLEVRMHLLGMPGSCLEEIRTAVSHPVALRQCAQSLARLGLEVEESTNTALAAKGLANPHQAVLASEAAAAIYGLAILQRDIHDRPDNATTFAIFAKGHL